MTYRIRDLRWIAALLALLPVAGCDARVTYVGRSSGDGARPTVVEGRASLGGSLR
jgi:hypothetical protein